MTLRFKSANPESATPSSKAVEAPSGTGLKLASTLVEVAPVLEISIISPKVWGMTPGKVPRAVTLTENTPDKVVRMEPVGSVVVGWAFDVSPKVVKTYDSE